MDKNVERFIVNEDAVGSAENRSPETLFELETMVGIVKADEEVRRTRLRELWDIAEAMNAPLHYTLGGGYLHDGLITPQEFEQFLTRMSPYNQRISAADSRG